MIDIKLGAVVQRWIKEHQYGTSIWRSVFAIQEIFNVIVCNDERLISAAQLINDLIYRKIILSVLLDNLSNWPENTVRLSAKCLFKQRQAEPFFDLHSIGGS